MRKFLSIFIVFCLMITFASCSKTPDSQKTEKKSVIINSPDDDTVNGYRENKLQIENEKDNQSVVKEEKYCGNINSKVFHLQDCKSVSKMKEENKYFSKDKEHLIELGFTPCKSCKP